jgi:hypothetical protein
MIIRKLSVGTDPLKAMHFQVGSFVMNGSHQIESIQRREHGFDIWILNDNKEIIRWKTVSDTMPVIIEHNIDF